VARSRPRWLGHVTKVPGALAQHPGHVARHFGDHRQETKVWETEGDRALKITRLHIH